MLEGISIKSVALAMPTVPASALMLPWLLTLWAIKNTLPLLALRVPKLVMLASELPKKFIAPPSRNSLSFTSRVLAINAAVLMVAPLPTRIPLGLMRYTCPLELSVPRISEGLPPTTRFNTAEDALGI
nr:hypothetical protein [Methylophilus sp. TWE2]